MASGFGHVSQPRIVLLLFPESISQTEGKTSPVDDVLQLKQSDSNIKMLALRMKNEKACIHQIIFPSAYEKLNGLVTLALATSC